MENSFWLEFIANNISLIITATSALAFFVVNIILAIKNKDKKGLIDVLLKLPEVINQIEDVSKGHSFSPLQKKSMAEALLKVRYGTTYIKNYKLLIDTLEDILSTPQKGKKGGSDDVSKESEER